MPASITCSYNGKLVDIEEALRIKKQLGKMLPARAFVCVECSKPVKPHRGGAGNSPHFEHIDRNSRCSLSHKIKNASNTNPDWVRDELILALDVYLRFRPTPPGKDSSVITELSSILRALGRFIFPDFSQPASFRNPNGVYMKLMNFRRFDPSYTVDGKKGLQRGAKGEESVWLEFADDPVQCKSVADAIRANLKNPDTVKRLAEYIEDDIEEAEEGRLLTRTHMVRERDRNLVAAKRKQVEKKFGKLACEACGFDFAATYGNVGDGYIECHHSKPLSSLTAESKTHINDLVLLCSNCHRIVHRKKPWLSVPELKALLKLTATS